MRKLGNFKIFFLFHIFIFAMTGQAAQQCIDLFTDKNEKKILSILDVAAVIDQLNDSHGGSLFTKSIADAIKYNFENVDPNSKVGVTLRYQNYRINKILKSAKGKDGIDQFDLRDLVKKLNSLDFLSDQNATKQMSIREKYLYSLARESLMYHGLESFFLADQKIPASFIKTWFSQLKKPFSAIYRQWHKLNNGPLLPEDLAFQIYLQGTHAHKKSLAPYSTRLGFQFWYDGAALIVNRLAISAFAIGISGFIVLNIHAVNDPAPRLAAEKNAIESLSPLRNYSIGLLATDKVAERFNAHVQNSIAGFIEKFGREPTDREIAILTQAVKIEQSIYFKIEIPDSATKK